MKKTIMLLLIVFMFLGASCSKNENKNLSGLVKTPKNIDEKFSYAYVYDLLNRLKQDSMNLDEELILQAVHDAFTDSAKINPAERQAIVTAMQDTVRVRSIAKYSNQSKNLNDIAAKIVSAQNGYVEKSKNTDGYKSTKSGLLYKVLKEGTGKTATFDDIMEVNIIGTFADGTEFDNSYKAGKSLNFPANGLFKGWGEAMSLLKEGGKGKFIFTPDLAFGAQGAPPKIPGDAIVVFEVEFIKINGKYDMKKLKDATNQK